MLIRRERIDDQAAVHRIHTAAFAPQYEAATPPEPGLVDDLRRDPAWIEQLSLVAELDGVVVGHVCCTRAHLLPDERPVLGLGPIGVAPEHQRDGVGKALMHAVVAAAEATDEQLIVLLGHPDYYWRFGFVPAADLNITPPVAEWTPAFFARALSTYDTSLAGEFQYAEPFRRL